MNRRQKNKDASYRNIVQAAAVRLREEGLSGAGIAAIMKDAGLTHGAFYAHFANKEQLIAEAFARALAQNRPRWINPPPQDSWGQRLKYLARHYLTRAHRDNLAASCALGSLVSDAGRANPAFKSVYEKELYKTIQAICGDTETCERRGKFDEALMFMALSIGGIALSRAVDDKQLAERILAACRRASERLSFRQRPVAPDSAHVENKTPAKQSMPKLDQFPLKTHEKLRYGDTDRQGHVNNAVFATMLETGRVEILYDPAKPLHKANCSFVIVHQAIDFRAEITWPGQVRIGTRIESIGRSSMIFKHGLFQAGKCVATGKAVVVQVNLETNQSEPLGTEAIERLSDYMD